MNSFSTQVSQIVSRGLDSTGAVIETVYAKVVPHYAVYQTAERVVVHYADNDDRAEVQRRELIASNPLKGEINGLIDCWRRSNRPSDMLRARLFDRRVADALVVALQGEPCQSVELLNAIKHDIVAERTSIARTSYVFTSFAATVVFALLFGVLAATTPEAFASGIYASAGVGALGAFFSIALAIRGRQIGTDLQWRDNHTDAALRVVIGAVSAAVLFCLLHAKVVTVSFGGGGTATGDSGTAATAFTFVAAFLAGFTERLVGDLLGRATANMGGAADATANPLAGTAVVRPSNVREDTASNANTNLQARMGAGVAAVAAAPGARPDEEPQALTEEDMRDGCLDQVDLPPEAMTRDVELPAALGGVAQRA